MEPLLIFDKLLNQYLSFFPIPTTKLYQIKFLVPDLFSYLLFTILKYFYFSASFFFVALAFISKILATIPYYSKQLNVETVALLTVTSHIIKKVSWTNYFGISISRFLMLFAFLILLMVCLKVRDKKVIALFIYFLIISTTFVSVSYLVFHITLLIMLSILYLTYRRNYLRVKSKNSKMVMYSFLAILISQVFFIFEGLIEHFYVIGEIIQLIGYLVLLFAIISMMLKK